MRSDGNDRLAQVATPGRHSIPGRRDLPESSGSSRYMRLRSGNVRETANGARLRFRAAIRSMLLQGSPSLSVHPKGRSTKGVGIVSAVPTGSVMPEVCVELSRVGTRSEFVMESPVDCRNNGHTWRDRRSVGSSAAVPRRKLCGGPRSPSFAVPSRCRTRYWSTSYRVSPHRLDNRA